MDINWAPKYHHYVSSSNDIMAGVTPIFRINKSMKQPPTYTFGIKARVLDMLGTCSITEVHLQ